MSHFFFIEKEHVPAIRKLFQDKLDGEFIVIAESNGFSDIIQYTDKYQNVKVITVRSEKLNRAMEMKSLV